MAPRIRKTHHRAWGTSLPKWTVSAALLASCSAGPSDDAASVQGPVMGLDDAGVAGSGGAPTTTGSANGASSGTASSSGGDSPMDPEPTWSFIWVANTNEGTVSKIDTRSLVELARYRVSPQGKGRPSRTSVGPDGSVAVANRGGVQGQVSIEAGVTKIYASIDQCVDKNGNSQIETSTGKNDVLAWGKDECVAWHRPLDFWSNRPVAYAPNLLPDAPGGDAIWTAGTSLCSSSSCEFDVIRLSGDTGKIEDRVTVGPLSGPDFIFRVPGATVSLLENYGPYGGASDGGGNFWTFTATTTHLVRLDALSLAVRTWPIPEANGYGIAIDSKGRVFVCGAQGLSRFDPATETWAKSPSTSVALGYNGCMGDGDRKMWVGGGSDSGDPGLHAFDVDTLEWIESYPVGPVKGVSIDIDGFIWGVSANGASGGGADTAYRLDPKTGDVKTYAGLNEAYSYSDMTGFGLMTAGVVPII